MFTFSIQPELKEKFPSHATAWFGPVPLSQGRERAGSVVESLKTQCRDTITASNADDVPEIRNWREVFKKVGASPNYKPSIQLLFEQYRKAGALWTIDPVVDLYNWISLSCLIPMAAYDEAQVRGPIKLRLAKKGEPFTPLGNPKSPEKTGNGEVVYADDEKVLCRCWNKQDCYETRLTDKTEAAVFFADLIDDEVSPVEKISARIAGLLEAGLGCNIETHLVR